MRLRKKDNTERYEEEQTDRGESSADADRCSSCVYIFVFLA